MGAKPLPTLHSERPLEEGSFLWFLCPGRSIGADGSNVAWLGQYPHAAQSTGFGNGCQRSGQCRSNSLPAELLVDAEFVEQHFRRFVWM